MRQRAVYSLVLCIGCWAGVGVSHGQVFTDVTSSVGLDVWTPAPTYFDYNAAWGDYNQDGYVDLFVGDTQADGSLFTNHDGLSFSVSSPPVTVPGMFVDYTNDGLPDITTALAGGHVLPNLGDGTFGWAVGVMDEHPWQSECAAWADFDGDGDLDSYRSGWEEAAAGPYYPDALFITQSATQLDRVWYQETEADRRAGRGVTIADFDEDGDMDVFVANYRLGENYLLQNDGTGNFVDVASAYGVAGDDVPCSPTLPGGHSIGAAWGDLDNDGYLDLVVGNLSHGTACEDPPRFYRNLGPSGGFRFQDMSASVALPYVESHASPALADFDNDGDLDIFMSAVSGAYAGQQSTLLCNNGNWSFTDCSDTYGLRIATASTNLQAAWADYDNDGDLDLYTGQSLLENPLDNGNHWLMVKLAGDGYVVNSDAIGARVRIEMGGGTVLTRQVENATGWCNQNDPRLHFGLGNNAGPVDLTVTWPDGWVEYVRGVAVDQLVEVRVPRSLAGTPAANADDFVAVRTSTSLGRGFSDWYGSYTDADPVFFDDPDGTGTGDAAATDTVLLEFGQAGAYIVDAFVGDVTGDGLADAVLTYADPTVTSGAGDPKVSWIAAHSVDDGSGNGQFDATTLSGGPALNGFGGSIGNSVARFLGDVNGDGVEDMIHLNAGYVWNAAYSVPGAGLSKASTAGPFQFGLPPGSGVVDQPFVGDFNGDGRTDIGVYRIPGGNVFIAFTDANGALGLGGTAPVGQIGGNPGEDAVIVANLDGDTDDDLVMVRQDGVDAIDWFGLLNDGTGFFDFFNPGTSLSSFGLDGDDQPLFADVNGDAADDICVWRPSGGQWFTTFTTAGGTLGVNAGGDDAALFGFAASGDVPLLAQMQSAGDTQDDLIIFRPPGSWFASYTLPAPDYWDGDLTTPAATDTELAGFGIAEETYLLGDVDGNGIDDVVAVGQTDPTGTLTLLAGHTVEDMDGLGLLDDTVASIIDFQDDFAPGATEFFLADFDNDAIDDVIAMVRGETHMLWYGAPSGIDGLGGGGAIQGPVNNFDPFFETPLVGDFDGDGYADTCSVSPGTLQWFVTRTDSSGVLGGGGLIVPPGQFGIPGDMPLVGDINGDGRTDGILYRTDPDPAVASQFFVDLADTDGRIDFGSGPTLTFSSTSFGFNTDVPFVADINGDGLDDVGVTRGTTHFVLFTTPDGLGQDPLGDDVAQFGLPGDTILFGQIDNAADTTVCNVPPQDANGDGLVGATDLTSFLSCYTGPGITYSTGGLYECACFDADGSLPHGDIDLVDFATFQTIATGE